MDRRLHDDDRVLAARSNCRPPVRSISCLGDFGLCAQLVRLGKQSQACMASVEPDLEHINLGLVVATERDDRDRFQTLRFWNGAQHTSRRLERR